MRSLEESVAVNPLVPTAYDVAMSIIWVAVVLFAVAAFISVVRARYVTGLLFLLWAGLILFAPVIGSTAWFLFGRRRKPRVAGSAQS